MSEVVIANQPTPANQAVMPSRIPLDDYAALLGQAEIDELRLLAKPLHGRAVEMINSTAVGGGVAEILNRLVPLTGELGIKIRWDVMTGGDAFFRVTKAFHNALHGAPYHAEAQDFEVFLATNERGAEAEWQPLGLALPHRSFAPQSHGVGIPRKVCGAL